MNYSGGGNTAEGWEALLLNSFYGAFANGPTAENGADSTQGSGDPAAAGVGGSNNSMISNDGTNNGQAYDPSAFANYMQNNNYTNAPPPSTNHYYTNVGGNCSVNNPLGYSGSDMSGGYSLTMPANQAGTAGASQHQQFPPPTAAAATAERHPTPPAHYLHTDPFADYNAYINQTRAATQQRQQQHQIMNYTDDFCDALLQGLEEPSFPGASAATAPADFNSYQQHQPFTTMRGSAGAGGMYMGGGQASQPSNHHQNSYNTNVYVGNQRQPPAAREQPSRQAATAVSRSRISSSRPRRSPTTTLPASSSSSLQTTHSTEQTSQVDPILESITLQVSSVSLSPLSGNEIVTHIRAKTADVTSRFIPCVDFLVNCQQELRQGLQIAQRRRVTNHGRGTRTTQNMTPRQFHNTYVVPLPRRFERSNQSIMARENLNPAKVQLQQLVKESAQAIPQGCDHVKNAFLGGMRENESWGLRKWLSKHGGAGSICNDLEEVMRMVKKMKKEDTKTKRLTEMLRPIARRAHERLKKDVPQAYQEQSSAHPYLPFFHRLEACLKQMATYDPEDDDVICLDDSDDEDDVEVVVNNAKSPMKSSSNAAVKESAANTTPVKRRNDYDDFANGTLPDESCVKRSKPGENMKMSPMKKAAPEIICLDDSSDEEEEEDDETNTKVGARSANSTIPQPLAEAKMPSEAVEPPKAEKWRCPDCTYLNSASSTKCVMCQDESSDGADELANFLGGDSFLGGPGHSYSDQMSQTTSALQSADARELEYIAQHISLGGKLPHQAQRNQNDQVWGAPDKFPRLLGLFRTIIQHPLSHRFVEPVNEGRLFIMGMPSYTSIVRHPICFHAIVQALSRSEDAVSYPRLETRLANGELGIEGLRDWNMWNGLHLIEAIDLVFLNSLAYYGNDTQKRSETESLRKILWDGVNLILNGLQPHERSDHFPNRRSENSSFVIR